MERSRSGVRLSAGLGSRRLSPRPHGLQRFPDSRAQARGSLGCLRSIPGWVRTPALCRVFAHMPASSLRCPSASVASVFLLTPDSTCEGPPRSQPGLCPCGCCFSRTSSLLLGGGNSLLARVTGTLGSCVHSRPRRGFLGTAPPGLQENVPSDRTSGRPDGDGPQQPQEGLRVFWGARERIL